MFLLAILPQEIRDEESWLTGTTHLGCHYSKTWSFTGLPELLMWLYALVTINAHFFRVLLDAIPMLATKKGGKLEKKAS